MRRNLFSFRHSLNLLRPLLASIFLFFIVGCVPPEEDAQSIKIESITPSSGLISGGFEVKIKGENFTFIEEITINGSPCTDPTVTGTIISCTAPAVNDIGEVPVVLRSKGNRTGFSSFTYSVASFSVTSFSPQYAVPAGGVLISLQGSNFVSGMSVTVGGIPCTNVKFISSTLLQCTLPANNSGFYDVVVSNKFDSIKASGQFTYKPLPTITSVSPVEGPITGGTVLTISGTNFLSSAMVQIGRGSCIVTSVSLTGDEITCLTPVGTTGLTNITVTQPGKLNVTKSNAFTYLTPPTVLSVSPSGGPIAGGTSLTIKGTNFTASSTVKVGTIDCLSPVVVNTETITCTTATNFPNSGTYGVTVTDAKNLTSTLANAFSYQQGPIIADVTPKGTQRTVSTTVTITGTNFKSGSTVKIVAPDGGNTNCPVTTTPTATQIVCQTPITTLSGNMDIIVTNPDGQTDTWDNFGFRNRPTISTISPLGGPMDGRNWQVNITGTDFSNPKVKMGNNDCVVANFTSTSIACTINSTASFGYVTVAVTNQYGGVDEQSASKPNGYFFNNGPEARASNPVLPIGGPPSGGTSIKIYGKSGDQTRKFFGTPIVKFGLYECKNVTVSPDGEMIDCVTPEMPFGVFNISIKNPDTQEIQMTNAFTVSDPPSISSIEPDFSSKTGNTQIKIKGSSFYPSVTVKIGNKDCPIVSGTVNTSSSPNELQCKVPSGAEVVDVTVTNPDTQSGKVLRGFTYRDAPTITGVSASFGKVMGGDKITLTGTNFYPGIKIYFGPNECTSVIFINSTTVSCDSTPAGSGSVKLKVVNKEGQFFETITSDFSYLETPSIDSILPSFGGFAQSLVTITGDNLYDGLAVEIGDKACTEVSNVQVNQVTQKKFITCKVPLPAAAGSYAVVVKNKDNQSATLTPGYLYISPPVITSISPSRGKVDGGDIITISGNYFDAGLTVEIGQVVCDVQSSSGTDLTCKTRASAAGAKILKVTNQDSQFAEVKDGFTYVGAATLGSLSPNAGPVSGSNEVTITGTNFITGTTVHFVINGTDYACPIVGEIKETEIKCTVPAPPGGTTFPYTADIKLTNLPGQATLSTGKYVYRVAPTLTGLSNAGSISIQKASSGGTIYLNGTGFVNEVTALFGASESPCAQVSNFSATKFECKIPTLTNSTYTVKVKNPEGQVSTTSNLQIISKPTVTGISPSQGSISGGATVTISGTGFVSGATVSIGGANCSSVVVNEVTSTITCTNTANTQGLKTVVVTNPDLSQSTQSDDFAGFTYMAQPTITAITPNGGPPGISIPIKITGTSFYSGATVLIGTKSCTVTAVSSSEITCTTPNDLTAGTSYDVKVTNLDGQFRTSSGGFTSSNPPTISYLSPNVGPIGGGSSVNIIGTGFKTGAKVKFNNGTEILATFNSSVSLSVTTPVSLVSGAVSVMVTNSDGQSAMLNSGYIYLRQPSVTSVSPNQGPIAGGTTVTITGTDFFAGATVKVGSGDCLNVNVLSSTSITCLLPGQTAGAKTVEVKNSDNQVGSLASGYTYYAAPVISGISPTSGRTTGGTLLTISGSGFRSGSAISVGTVTCDVDVNTISDSSIKCITRPGEVGSYKVKVTNIDGQQFESTSELFTYRGLPTISSLSPISGPASGGTTLTITGTNFFSGDKIVLGDPNASPYQTFDCNNISRVDSTTMTCVTPAKAARVYDVMVKSSDATTQYKQFTYRPAPVISDVTPSSGVQAGGTSIMITGTGIDAQTVVKVGGKTCTNADFKSNTSLTITCSTPPSSVGAQKVELSVVNIDGQSTTSASGFTYTAVPILKFKVGTISPTPPNPDDYGSTSTNITHTFTLENIGEGTTSAITVAITGTDSAAWIRGTDNCQGQQLAPNANCTIQVTFLGGSLTAGSYTAILNATATSGGTTTNTLKGTRSP